MNDAWTRELTGEGRLDGAAPFNRLKVAIVHYWLVKMRGGERVLESLCELFPQADLFTHVVDPNGLSEALKRHRIRTTFIAKLPGARRHYQKYLPLMPLALEELDLTAYDLVISSESGPAKGVIVRPDTLHVCYCHSPMRYAWDHYHVYRANAGRLTRALLPVLMHLLRQWDVTSSARVDQFVANSHFVAQRIRKYYRREAEVIFPPVDVAAAAAPAAREDAFLYVGELVHYKRADLAIKAFAKLGKRLTVIGDGEERRALERIAGPTVTFLGKVPLPALRAAYASHKALVFPGEEDFGMVPVEAMAAGTPVIAYGRGGALDTVVDGVTGLFFAQPTAEALAAAVQVFEARASTFDAERIRAHAAAFSREAFQARFAALIRAKLAGAETSGARAPQD